jgi:hypothetical protein
MTPLCPGGTRHVNHPMGSFRGRLCRWGHALYRGPGVMRKHTAERRQRVKCPVCGRRLRGRILVDTQDMEIFGVAVPPHKAKGWWKK